MIEKEQEAKMGGLLLFSPKPCRGRTLHGLFVTTLASPAYLWRMRARLLFLLFILPVFSNAQNDTLRFFEPAPGFVPARAYSVYAGIGALSAGSLIGLQQVWYKQYRSSSFHFFNDNSEWLQMDKCGHLFTCFTTGRASTNMLSWAGVNEKKATWIGGMTGFAYLTVIECFDGFSSGWGFSWGDMAANTTGAALFIGQQLGWKEQRITVKFGFVKSDYAQYRPSELGGSFTEQLIKDYNGQTYWLSFSIASFLSSSTHFPKWLNLAFGYGANGMTGGKNNPVMTGVNGNTITFERYRQFYLSPDIDLTKIPVRSHFLKAVFNTIGFLKIPAPAIELSRGNVYGHWLSF